MTTLFPTRPAPHSVARYPYPPLPCHKQYFPPGPWQGEPDVMDWKDLYSDLRCSIVRHHALGVLNGFVALPSGHPLHRLGIDAQVPAPAMFRWQQPQVADVGVVGVVSDDLAPTETGNVRLGSFLFCHHGITYAAADPEGVWWLGFSCDHVGDKVPAHAALLTMTHETFATLPSVLQSVMSHLPLPIRRVLDANVLTSTYRDIAYVRRQTNRLARQIWAYGVGQPIDFYRDLSNDSGRSRAAG